MSDAESTPLSAASHPGSSSSSSRRRRSRGGRGRGRRRSSVAQVSQPVGPPNEISPDVGSESVTDAPAEPAVAGEAVTEDESFFAPAPEVDVPNQPAGPATEAPAVKRPEEDKPAAPPVTRAKHPARPEAIRQAIDEVMQVIASLRESLEQLDEVLELLEEAERQKTADERDIESLRQQLRRFHRPPEEGSRSRSPQAQSGQRQPHRHQGDERRLHRSPRESREPRAPHEAHKAHRSHAAQPKSLGPLDAEIRQASPGSESTEPGSGTASSPADATGAGDPS